MAKPPIEPTWPLQQVAKILQVHPATIWRYMRQNPDVFTVRRLRRVGGHPRRHRALTLTEIRFLEKHIVVNTQLFPDVKPRTHP